MQPLSATELLHVWEQGASRTLPQRALGLLAAASRDLAPDVLAQLSIGQRDQRLLTLRIWMFGSALPAVAQCPRCAERVEITLDTQDLLAIPQAGTQPERSFALAGYAVRWRLPATRDLLELEREFADVTAAREQLLARCLLSVERQGGQVALTELPAFVVDRVVQEMAQADPQADIQLELSCPACRHGWSSLFDILSFLWSEISAWAQRILREVHTLAAAYGWSEADVLSMSAWRRQLYLQMANP